MRNKKRVFAKQSEENEGVNLYHSKDNLAAFLYYFSTLDCIGLNTILKENFRYDGYSKSQYITLFEEQFESLKKENIHYLKPIPGICLGCKNGCSGFTFLDEKKGFYLDLIIEMRDTEIVNFMECFNLKNEIKVPNKIEQIVIEPFELDSNSDCIPF